MASIRKQFDAGFRCQHVATCAIQENNVAWGLLRKIVAAAVSLLVSLTLTATRAMAEEDLNAALRAYDLGDPNDRKTAEIVFANEQNGIWWANSVLFYKSQQPLFCPPDNMAPLPGPQVIEMVRHQLSENPKLGGIPYGLAILMAIQITYPCKN